MGRDSSSSFVAGVLSGFRAIGDAVEFDDDKDGSAFLDIL